MAYRTPGDFIHYCASGSGLLAWPAVICTHDVAPAHVLRTRPSGYVTLVLRLGDALDFHWALPTEMQDYNPMVPFEAEDMVANTPGLGEAYAVANSALEAGLGLEHWRDQVENRVVIISSDEESSDTYSEEDNDSDRDLQRAIRESQRELLRKSQGPSFLSVLPSKKRKPESDEENNIGERYRPSKTETPQVPPQQLQLSPSRDYTIIASSPRSDEETQRREGSGTSLITGESSKDPTFIQKVGSPSKYVLGSGSNDLLSWDRLGKISSVPTSDAIEGDLTSSKQFVRLRVGLEGEERLLHRNCVWDRPYFKDLRNGIMYFELDDDGMWELAHPGLADVSLEDFVFIAEYLESASFGHKYPQDEGEMVEAFAQMGAAWTVAEHLGMTDLMEHVVDKLEGLAPWNLLNTVAFAWVVYASSAPALPAQERLKDLLVTEIAQNYWIYIEDDHLNEVFIERLKALPELERDIYLRRTAALNARLNAEEESEEEENNEDDNDMDGFEQPNSQ